MPISVTSRHRYSLGIIDDEQRVYLDPREPFRFRSHRGNRFRTVIAGDTWWGLAGVYFRGVPRPAGLWWVLCEYQPTPVVDPTLALQPGDVVVIPSLELVRTTLFSEDQRRYH